MKNAVVVESKLFVNLERTVSAIHKIARREGGGGGGSSAAPISGPLLLIILSLAPRNQSHGPVPHCAQHTINNL